MEPWCDTLSKGEAVSSQHKEDNLLVAKTRCGLVHSLGAETCIPRGGGPCGMFVLSPSSTPPYLSQDILPSAFARLKRICSAFHFESCRAASLRTLMSTGGSKITNICIRMCLPQPGGRIRRTGFFDESTPGSLSHMWVCNDLGRRRSEDGRKLKILAAKRQSWAIVPQPCVLWRLCGCIWAPAPLLLHESEARCGYLPQLCAARWSSMRLDPTEDELLSWFFYLTIFGLM